MKLLIIFLLALTGLIAQETKNNKDINFDDYLLSFDYQERKDMKINIKTLIQLYHENKVQIIDIRFPEEVEGWSFSFIKSIPVNELPKRLDELDKDKIIVTVCPKYDRAALARHYLTLKGYKSKYLVEGLLGLSDYLRGDNSKEFSERTRQ